MNYNLVDKLEQSTALRKSRNSVRNFMLRNENAMNELVAIAFNIEDENHHKALWCLELICEKKMKLFVSYIDQFCEVLPNLKNDSAIRPATKMCMFLAKSNHRKNGISLTQNQEHNIIEALIDRLIQDEKVAAKAYSMKALYVFGKKYNWVNDELKLILPQDYPNHSAAYKAVAREILKKINK